MKRPSSPAQMVLLDLPPAPLAQAGAARRGRHGAPSQVRSWKRDQAAANARSSEELLARLASSPEAMPPHAGDRPHPPADAPHEALPWRAEALAELFAAVERASAAQADNTVRRAAG